MLSSRLKDLRTQKKITQEELANHLSIPRGTYAHYELGKREPDNNMLLRIASFFNVSTDYLLGLTDDPTKTPYQSPKTVSELREGKIAYGDLSDAQKRILARSEEMSKKDQEQFADLADAFFKTRQDNRK